jgi:hypothetical protein
MGPGADKLRDMNMACPTSPLPSSAMPWKSAWRLELSHLRENSCCPVIVFSVTPLPPPLLGNDGNGGGSPHVDCRGCRETGRRHMQAVGGKGVQWHCEWQ